MSAETLIHILAIDLTARGFGFVVLEGPESLIDWGVVRVVGEQRVGTLGSVEEILSHYDPDVVVLEDNSVSGSRRYRRIREFLVAILALISDRKVRLRTCSRRQCERYSPGPAQLSCA